MKHTLVTLSLIIFAALCLIQTASATELRIPGAEAKPGEILEIPVIIDSTDNLAGVKLVMKYNTDILTFKKAGKTSHTSSLMHIVNSKKPGSLVVVMAGARGISGADFPILTLKFEVKKDIKGARTTQLEVRQIEMMSDQLKTIKCKVKSEPLKISGAESSTGIGKPESRKPEQEAQKSEQEAQKPEQEAQKPEQEAQKSEQKIGHNVRSSRRCPLTIPSGDPDSGECRPKEE